jgi:FkbM family methyltransferase
MLNFLNKCIILIRYLEAYCRLFKLGLINKLSQNDINVLRYLLHDINYFKNNKFDLILDVGANKGEFASIYRQLYPDSDIICFEPIPSLVEQLEKIFKDDSKVEIKQFALSDIKEEVNFRITKNVASSSMFDPNESNQLVNNGADIVDIIKVKADRLDNILDSNKLKNKKIMCKIDVQGAELLMLKGAQDTLKNINTLIIECGFLPLYEGEASFDDIYQYLRSKDFSIVGVLKQSGKLPNGFSRNLDIVLEKNKKSEDS